jgi:ParB family chromosome partitioning protein
MAVQKKRALGKGLDALFGEINIPVSVDSAHLEENQSELGRIVYIDVDDIKPNSMQPRQDFNEESIQSLADSIKQHGVIQPVMLQKGPNGYELVAGERRWRAARAAGLKEVPSFVRELSQEENALFAIIENVQREDLNPMEEAIAFRNVMDTYGITQEGLSKSIGKSRPHIANTLRILKLPEPIQELLLQGKLTLGHANAIGGIADKQKQTESAKQIVRESLSVREAEALAARASGKVGEKKKKAQSRKKSEEIRRVEEELTSLMGTRVTLGSNGKSGVIEIHYYSRDELDGLIEELRGLEKFRG